MLNSITRRRFLQTVSAATAAGAAWPTTAAAIAPPTESSWRIAPFRFDVTPPLGHSCCGGWITPVKDVDDRLEALGFVLIGGGLPIVVCAVDWTGILNEAHVAWREALAAAAHTTADRVAVHCVHQHNAPFACLEAERIVQQQGDLPHIVDLTFFDECLERGKRAVTEALSRARPVTHVAYGQARVAEVAANRRVSRGPDGRVLAMRGSSCTDAALRGLPEGLIDPWLKTTALYDGDHRLVACHHYATHPMSFYGDGRVSSDFPGLARKRRQEEDAACLHIYFTGCAGNVAAGKYNDGSPEMRPVLVQRMYEALVASERELMPMPLQDVTWKTVEILPRARGDLDAAALEARIADKMATVVNRNRPAYMLAWLRRLERKLPIVLSSLGVNDARWLHLPGECFVEYQLRAQQLRPGGFVAVAAYGDGGTWYIPTKEEYPLGGYEPSVANCDPEIDDLLTDGMRKLLA